MLKKKFGFLKKITFVLLYGVFMYIYVYVFMKKVLHKDKSTALSSVLMEHMLVKGMKK